jgi:hypothetical protein
MAFARRLLPADILPAFLAFPASAKVIAEGKPTAAGLYWQKVEKKNGTVSYLCRSKSNSKILKSGACDKGGAKKPSNGISDIA